MDSEPPRGYLWRSRCFARQLAGAWRVHPTDHDVLCCMCFHNPCADEHPGVLPLPLFINPKLNRYGRGCAACLYFGNHVSVETFRVSGNVTRWLSLHEASPTSLNVWSK